MLDAVFNHEGISLVGATPPEKSRRSAVHPVVRAMLAPLSKYYDDLDLMELFLVGPQRLVLQYRNQPEKAVEDSSLSIAAIEKICKTLANHHRLNFDPVAAPNLSCTLPGGHRFECAIGASIQEGVSATIRCKHPFEASPQDFGLDEDIAQCLFRAVEEGQHIVISGGTNTGKTTLLNMLLRTLPTKTRILCAEDTPEIVYDQFYKGMGLIAARSAEVPGQLTWPGITDHINRSTPDRVIFGEISVRNAQSALAVLNAGIEGFMCTIHASTPEMALKRKFGQNLDMAGTPMQAVHEFLNDMVDLVIQINRSEGCRKVVSVWDVKHKTELLK